MIRRRKMAIIVPVVVILLVTLSLAYGLPSIYQSTATILIEQQEIPQDLVPSTVASYAAERIQTIKQRVMTRSNLLRIIEDNDLYPEERDRVDSSLLVMRLKENIEVRMVSADVLDPRKGRAGKATIAFEISFKNETPEGAQRVAQEIVSLFLAENLRLRTQKAEVTSDFLAEEASRLGAEITKLEEKLADFKEQNIGRLPQQLNMNMSLLDRTSRELEVVERQLYTLEERKMTLESQLTQLEPYTAQSPQQRLEELEAAYRRSVALYSSDHPDVVRMRREIEYLRETTGSAGRREALEAQIREVQGELSMALEKYSSDHPDVARLQNTLAGLQADLRALPEEGVIGREAHPDNPAYVSVLTQLEGIKINIQAERERRQRLREKLELYEKRLLAMPGVEQEWLILRRDYDNAVKKYKEIKDKQLRAEISEKLERDSMGERFTVIDPPNLPRLPVEPDRPGILILGTVFSFAGGVIFAAFREFTDRTLYGARAVARLLQAPPLSVIPRIRNREDERRKRKRTIIVMISVILGLALILAIVHFLWMPLDALWETIAGNAGLTG